MQLTCKIALAQRATLRMDQRKLVSDWLTVDSIFNIHMCATSTHVACSMCSVFVAAIVVSNSVEPGCAIWFQQVQPMLTREACVVCCAHKSMAHLAG